MFNDEGNITSIQETDINGVDSNKTLSKGTEQISSQARSRPYIFQAIQAVRFVSCW